VSIRLMSMAWSLDLPAPRKLVMLKLADHASDDGVCWPALDYIAAHCGMSRRMVMIHIHALCAAGLVSREPRYDSRGGQSSNLYHLHFSSPSSPPSASPDPPQAPPDDPGPTVSASDTDTGTTAHLSAPDEVAEYVRLAAQYGRPEEQPSTPAGLRRYLRRVGLTIEHREQMAAWRAEEAARSVDDNAVDVSLSSSDRDDPPPDEPAVWRTAREHLRAGMPPNIYDYGSLPCVACGRMARPWN